MIAFKYLNNKTCCAAAGSAVDAFIDNLVPLLEAGDIIIDGGNSEYQDSQRRAKALKAKGLLFVGSGVSGGEEGARYGPSIMPGGHIEAWPAIKPIFQSIAAKVDGEPCCDWVGNDGAGHFVKMVHNGIEYGDMQVICEAYQLLRDALGLNHDEMSDIFADWNKREIDSFLVEITRDILKYKDTDGEALVTKIKDSAGQVRLLFYWRSIFKYVYSIRKEQESGQLSLPLITEFQCLLSENLSSRAACLRSKQSASRQANNFLVRSKPSTLATRKSSLTQL